MNDQDQYSEQDITRLEGSRIELAREWDEERRIEREGEESFAAAREEWIKEQMQEETA